VPGAASARERGGGPTKVNRRRLLACLGVALGASALSARGLAEQRVRLAKVGFLYFASRKSAIESRRYPAFVKGMSELGYVEGKNFVIEARFADGKAERLPLLASELVRAGVEVIVAGGNAAINAARQATKSVPIVIAQSPDPVAQGWATSLARPGGNITGLISLASEIELKMVEFMQSVVPGLARLAVLSNPANRTHAARVAIIGDAAKTFGASVASVTAQTPDEIERAFELMARERVQALIVLGDTYFLSQARQIAGLALKNRLPSTHTIPDYAEAGGLIAYGPDIPDNFRRAAGYVDKVLKGAKPAELPIEQPTRFELTINMKTARALGLSIPKTLQFQADKVIE
jgi:putative ABC transport system substrate-binding protein